MAEHPARRAGLASQSAVRGHRRDEWLALFAADARVEDPIGVSPYDPVGEGHRGRDAIAAFWDKAIARSAIEFRNTDSFACGDEAAFVTTIRSTRDGIVVEVDAVVTYRVDADGKITALRAFWELERARTGAP
ncbi:nuclear transport factor 2 family protein [Nocardia otitidiscaviarum]|uniref:nuclear transport factor 2 family protein n=1 Tax=Nocardia otitidiscaviarum TaxID=1823 RepID=UPI0018956A3C|nr:nuclear transport factor 2 family protein [Nocardia otitidiscaviarum]MBF6238633.1 nuclear transport factor 2 family protein [Nocardia otitidiscaviarum]